MYIKRSLQIYSKCLTNIWVHFACRSCCKFGVITIQLTRNCIVIAPRLRCAFLLCGCFVPAQLLWLRYRGGCHASSNSRHLEEDVVNSLCNLQVRTIMSFEKSSIHHKTAYFSSMRRPMVDHWVANGCPMVVNIVVQFMSKRSNMHVSIYVQAKLHINS